MKKGLTFTAVRNLFFETYPQFQAERRTRKSQNQSFVDFVDFLMKSGKISEKTADNITLG